MPRDSHPNSKSTSTPSILVLEEYDALAAALKSALNRFAPGYSVSVAADLKAAEKLAKETRPSLLVIDFDPAYPGLTNFLQRVGDLCPGARALILAPKIPKQIAIEFKSPSGLIWLAKPFEISDFGTAVQALVEPESSRTNRGSLELLGVADIVLAQCSGDRSVLLRVDQKNDVSGEIHIFGGQIVHAATGKRRDLSALTEMFSWDDATIQEANKRAAGQRTIRDEWTEIFLDAVRDSTGRRAISKPTVSIPKSEAAPAPKPAPPPRAGKKIVVVDDTDMLLLFVEDALLFVDPDFQISTAPNGISGVKQVEQVMPDLVLLDYSLPDINGDEVCRRLLENEQTARVPIVMMSGHVPEMTATAEHYENVVATIPKPFLSEALTTLVTQILKENRRPTRRVSQRAKIEAPPPPKEVEMPRAEIAPPPVTPVRPVAPPPPPLPPPIIDTPIMPHVERAAPPPQVTHREMAPRQQISPAHSPALYTPAAIREGNEVVLGLFLQVVSMQLTPSLRMGMIRAKPTSLIVSLHVSPATIRAALPPETGFELGRVDLNPTGGIATVRLIPTQRPIERQSTRGALQIGALDLVPHESSKHVQLTPSQNAPMMMHLLAHLEIAGVELSTTFQLGQLVLKNRSNTVRVTLNSETVGQEQTGVFCEAAAVRLDASARIAELLLKPLK